MLVDCGPTSCQQIILYRCIFLYRRHKIGLNLLSTRDILIVSQFLVVHVFYDCTCHHKQTNTVYKNKLDAIFFLQNFKIFLVPTVRKCNDKVEAVHWKYCEWRSIDYVSWLSIPVQGEIATMVSLDLIILKFNPPNAMCRFETMLVITLWHVLYLGQFKDIFERIHQRQRQMCPHKEHISLSLFSKKIF